MYTACIYTAILAMNSLYSLLYSQEHPGGYSGYTAYTAGRAQQVLGQVARSRFARFSAALATVAVACQTAFFGVVFEKQ